MTTACTQLDEFADGELGSAAAEQFRIHLATCDRCQQQLEHRMQEMLVVDEGAPAAGEIIPIARSRNRYLAIGGALAAAAAAMVIVLSRHHAAPSEPHAMKLTFERAETNYMGADAAHIGDTLHLETSDSVWIYRDDHELVLACPGGPTCRANGLDYKITTHGVFSIVLVQGEAPLPKGDLDADVHAANQVGTNCKIVPVEVR